MKKLLSVLIISVFTIYAYSQCVPTSGNPCVTSCQASVFNCIEAFRKYETRVTQSSTSAPVDTVLVTTFPNVSKTWRRVGAGEYNFRCNNCFSSTSAKTFVQVGALNVATAGKISYEFMSDDSIKIITTDSLNNRGDGLLNNTWIKFMKYP